MTRAGWTAHEDKLRLMESLCCQLDDICTHDTQSVLREAVRAVADDLCCLQRKCLQIVERLENHRESLRAELHEQTAASAANVDDKILNTDRFVVVAACLCEKSLLHAVNCGRFCFWRCQSVVFCLCMKYLCQIHTEDVSGPALRRV